MQDAAQQVVFAMGKRAMPIVIATVTIALAYLSILSGDVSSADPRSPGLSSAPVCLSLHVSFAASLAWDAVVSTGVNIS